MAEMTIRLRVNPSTGKKDILVDLRSDEDSLPHEHEQQHRQLVDKLIEGGLLSESEVGSVIVTREEEGAQADAPQESPAQEQRRSQQEGN
ncbi:MAG: hypothetical protein ACR2NZ_04005 [Rubripirellula sp.]